MFIRELDRGRPVFPRFNFNENQCSKDLLPDEVLFQNLRHVAETTWNFLLDFLDRETCLPIDRAYVDGNELHSFELTSPTNIGLFLLSLSGAKDLSLITKDRVEELASKTIATLQRMERQFGLYLNWYHTDSSEPVKRWPGSQAEQPLFISSVDNGWLAAGLLLAREQLPSLSNQIDQIIDQMDFSLFYSPEFNNFSGGIELKSGQLAEWRYSLDYLSESRIIYYISYLLGYIDKDKFQNLLDNFPPETYGGSIFEALMPSLIIDEGQTSIPIFQELIHRQIETGSHHGHWGFSPCDDAQGNYREFGIDAYKQNGLNVVTPHALILALRYAPAESLTVLNQIVNGSNAWTDYGFYDSVDVIEKKSSGTWLYLNQAMIFLALANLTQDDCIRKVFSKLLEQKKSCVDQC